MEKTTFVVMVGALPRAAAATLEGAQADALTAQTVYQEPGRFEHRWDEYESGKVWRLMYRFTGRKGRYAWTQYAVHAVPSVDGDA